MFPLAFLLFVAAAMLMWPLPCTSFWFGEGLFGEILQRLRREGDFSGLALLILLEGRNQALFA